MFVPIHEIPKEHQRRAWNNGYWDKPVGYHIKATSKNSKGRPKKDSVAYRRVYILPKYLSQHVHDYQEYKKSLNAE